ncbi:hypothetical protein [Variovorax sp. RCC_210]|uniref:hypothetical protein n=1 Tax=Variovorax sp. RCC_210 TaxID=3239217 RepID=UPI003524A7AA
MLEEMDWRLQGVVVLDSVAEVDGGTQESPSERVMTSVDAVRLQDGRLLAFAIPNPSAMMLDASKRAFDAAQQLFAHESLKCAPRGFVQFPSNADAVDFAEHLIVSVLTAYTALECFANENIPPWLTYKKVDRKGETPRMLAKEQIEREVNLGVKLAVVLPQVFGVESPKGTSDWEAFVKLEKVRNRVVHMKHDDRRSGDVGVDTIWKALLTVASPYHAAKKLMDRFLCSVPHIPGLEFENCRPVRPRWHVECPHK